METTHPTRMNPQTYKATNKYLSFEKTLTRVARFYPNSKADFVEAKKIASILMPWLPAELTAIRGEEYTQQHANNRPATLISTLVKYDPRNWPMWGRPGYVMSLTKQIECRLALAVLARGTPITRGEIDGMLLGQSINLPDDLQVRAKYDHPETRFLSIVRHLDTNPQKVKLSLTEDLKRRLGEYQTVAAVELHRSYRLDYHLAGWVDYQLKTAFAPLRAKNAGVEIFEMEPEEMERQIDAFLLFHGIVEV